MTNCQNKSPPSQIYLFAHYHHIELLQLFFPCILKGLYWQIPKENKNKHFSPICRIGSNAASVWVLGRVIVGEIPSGADFHPDSQMLSSTNTQYSAAETTVFPSKYFSVFPLKYILYFWRNSARCSVCVCRNPHLAISPPAEEIDRKGGEPQISTQILQARFLMLIPALRFLMKSRRDTDRPIEMGRSLRRRLEAAILLESIVR